MPSASKNLSFKGDVFLAKEIEASKDEHAHDLGYEIVDKKHFYQKKEERILNKPRHSDNAKKQHAFFLL